MPSLYGLVFLFLVPVQLHMTIIIFLQESGELSEESDDEDE